MISAVKTNSLREFAKYGCKVTVVPAETSADEVLALKPDGIFLSNGPGDPATLEAKYVTDLPNKITSSYWKTADYLPLTEQNQVTTQVQAADGLFNMSGTYAGLSGFNQGKTLTCACKPPTPTTASTSS